MRPPQERRSNLSRKIGYTLGAVAVGIGILAWTDQVMHRARFSNTVRDTQRDPQVIASCEETCAGGEYRFELTQSQLPEYSNDQCLPGNYHITVHDTLPKGLSYGDSYIATDLNTGRTLEDRI